jgi:sugar-specific transcriptional regulator TrmB
LSGPLNSIEQNAEILSSFGLTKKQARVYLALVHSGTALVGEIAKSSKVRREEVYRILPKLERMGLIEKTLSVPVKLKATSVENALAILIKEEEERAKNRIMELNSKKAEFLEHFRIGTRSRPDNDEQFSFVAEKVVILGKIEELIDRAQTEVEYCASEEKLQQFLNFFSAPLGKAIDRGIKIHLISKTPKTEDIDVIPRIINKKFSSNKLVSLRYLDNIPNHFLIIDDNEVLIATSTEGYLGDNPLLWSNNLPHVMVYKLLFKELWNSAVTTVTFNVENEDEKILSFVKQMKPGNHVILLYETSEGKLRILLNYVKYALENDEAATYVCSEASVEEIKEAMKLFGIDVKKYTESGALRVLDYTQHYIINGQFDAQNTMKLWSDYYKEAICKGFKGLRVIGETSCFFKHNLVKELVDYEKALHKTLDVPMIAICAYYAEQLMRCTDPVSLYPELVKAHGNVLFTWVDRELGRIAIS